MISEAENEVLKYQCSSYFSKNLQFDVEFCHFHWLMCKVNFELQYLWKQMMATDYKEGKQRKIFRIGKLKYRCKSLVIQWRTSCLVLWEFKPKAIPFTVY